MSSLDKTMVVFEQYMEETFATFDGPENLRNAMHYSLFSGGKRIRPAIIFATTMLDDSNQLEALFPFAMALEMVHTYSLIHDDLPAMDDDDMRRGKPSNHVKFGEALAILAGDGLLSHSFYLLQKVSVDPTTLVSLTSDFALSIGLSGMVSGQVRDVELEKLEHPTIDTLKKIHYEKTGKLFELAILGTSKISRFEEPINEQLRQISNTIGILFQAIDDYLDDDPTYGRLESSDEKNEKVNYVSLIGKQKLYSLIEQLVETVNEHINILKDMQCNVEGLVEIVTLMTRKLR